MSNHIRTLRSKKLHPEHVKLINEAIRNNARGKEKDLHITYRKENGEVSERKVRPLAVKGKSLFVAHCHERNAIRSFRVERIGMVKSAFWDGFEKQAVSLGFLTKHIHSGYASRMGLKGKNLSDYKSMISAGESAMGEEGKKLLSTPWRQIAKTPEARKQWMDAQREEFKKIPKPSNEMPKAASVDGFWDGFEKRAIGPRTLMRGAQAAMRRAGHEVDPSQIRFHGMEALTYPKRVKKWDQAAKYRAHAFSELFPKGKTMPLEEATRRFELAAHDNPFDHLMPRETERKALREAIEKKHGKVKSEL